MPQSARLLVEVHQVTESYKAELEKLRRENRTYCNTIVKLEMIVDESKQKLAHLDAAIPIKEIKKERQGRDGQGSWPLYIWDLILEQIVNGTPQSSVSENNWLM